jgi:hypothetical protein
MKYHRLTYMLLKISVVIELQNTSQVGYWSDTSCSELTTPMRDYVEQYFYTLALNVYNLRLTGNLTPINHVS